MARFAKDRFAEYWVPGRHYHVYNHAVHNNVCFRDAQDYERFIYLIGKRFTFFSDVLAFCLIPNHFHIALYLLEEDELRRKLSNVPRELLRKADKKYVEGTISYTMYIGQLVGDAMSAYAQYFNRRHGRKGPLMHRPIRRIETTNDGFSRKLIGYVGLNHVKHKMTAPTARYPFSSLYRDDKFLARERLLAGFGGEEQYARYLGDYLRRYGKVFYEFDELAFFGIEATRHAA